MSLLVLGVELSQRALERCESGRNSEFLAQGFPGNGFFV